MSEITVTLAGKPYTIGQLTIGQQRDLSIGVSLPENKADPQDNIRRAFDRNIAVIAAALSMDHPEMTTAALLQLRGCTAAERIAAVNTILEYAGLVPAEKQPGEADAASIGASSLAA
jgi:hypothetical protein